MKNNTQLKIVVLADWGYIKKAKVGIYDRLDSAFKSMIDMN